MRTEDKLHVVVITDGVLYGEDVREHWHCTYEPGNQWWEYQVDVRPAEGNGSKQKLRKDVPPSAVPEEVTDRAEGLAEEAF